MTDQVEVKYESDHSSYASDLSDNLHFDDTSDDEYELLDMTNNKGDDYNDDDYSTDEETRADNLANDMSSSSSSSEYNSGSDDETVTKNKAKGSLTNVLQNILGKRPTDTSIIMTKAKTERQIMAHKRVEDEEDGSNDAEKEASMSSLEQRKKKVQWEEMFRVKPDILNKDFERNLQKIATRGVVQLFNAVRKQQKIVDTKLGEAGKSFRRKDNVMASISKGDFLDVLQGQRVKKEQKVKQEVKIEPKTEPTWDQMSDSD